MYLTTEARLRRMNYVDLTFIFYFHLAVLKICSVIDVARPQK